MSTGSGLSDYLKLQIGGISLTNLSSEKVLPDNLPVAFIGNWVETSFYTGGRITSFTTASVLDRTYTVKTRYGIISGVESSDLYRYDIGEDVMLLKNYNYIVSDFTYDDFYAVKATECIIIPVEF